MGAAAKCVQVIVIILNFLLLSVGLAALGIGIWVYVDGTQFTSLMENIPDSGFVGKLISDSAKILIAAGATIAAVSFFGFFGACCKSKVLLGIYAALIALFVLLEIACIVGGYFYKDQLESFLLPKLANFTKTYYNSSFTPKGGVEWSYAAGGIVSKAVDSIQTKFNCCGVYNYTDYYNVSVTPVTCCPIASASDVSSKIWTDSVTTLTVSQPSCIGNDTYLSSPSVPGCKDAVYNWLATRSAAVLGIAAATLGLQVILFIFAICLCRVYGKEENKA